jgi:hypothetical protein
LLFQSSSLLPLFCLSFLCSAVWVIASVMHSALSFLCSFYSARLDVWRRLALRLKRLGVWKGVGRRNSPYRLKNYASSTSYCI